MVLVTGEVVRIVLSSGRAALAWMCWDVAAPGGTRTTVIGGSRSTVRGAPFFRVRLVPALGSAPDCRDCPPRGARG
jgi:hypothetical protein